MKIKRSTNLTSNSPPKITASTSAKVAGSNTQSTSKPVKRRQPKVTLAALESICAIANKEAFRFMGRRNTCVLTSAALIDALIELGYSATPMRLCVSVWPKDRNRIGVSIGSDGDGTRPAGAAKGYWNGHLAEELN